MENIVDITEHLEDRRWNESIEDLLLSCDGNPEDILILLESYTVGKRKVNGKF